MGTEYSVIEADGETLIELAPDEDTAILAAPKFGRTIQRDGVVIFKGLGDAWFRVGA